MAYTYAMLACRLVSIPKAHTHVTAGLDSTKLTVWLVQVSSNSKWELYVQVDGVNWNECQKQKCLIKTPTQVVCCPKKSKKKKYIYNYYTILHISILNWRFIELHDILDLFHGYELVCAVYFPTSALSLLEFDECATGKDLCDRNAVCINNHASYMCRCNPGYTGNGETCRGKLLKANDIKLSSNYQPASARIVDWKHHPSLYQNYLYLQSFWTNSRSFHFHFQVWPLTDNLTLEFAVCIHCSLP